MPQIDLNGSEQSVLNAPSNVFAGMLAAGKINNVTQAGHAIKSSLEVAHIMATKIENSPAIDGNTLLDDIQSALGGGETPFP